jgi:hypothetical protein
MRTTRVTLPRTLTAAICGWVVSSCGRTQPPREEKEIPVACSAEADPGIVVEVRDSITQRPIRNATLRIFSQGRVVDSAHSLADPGAMTPLAGAYERPGIYNAIVERRGYATWRRDDVQVVRGTCHVRSVHIVANMRTRR